MSIFSQQDFESRYGATPALIEAFENPETLVFYEPDDFVVWLPDVQAVYFLLRLEPESDNNDLWHVVGHENNEFCLPFEVSPDGKRQTFYSFNDARKQVTKINGTIPYRYLGTAKNGMAQSPPDSMGHWDNCKWLEAISIYSQESADMQLIKRANIKAMVKQFESLGIPESDYSEDDDSLWIVCGTSCAGHADDSLYYILEQYALLDEEIWSDLQSEAISEWFESYGKDDTERALLKATGLDDCGIVWEKFEAMPEWETILYWLFFDAEIEGKNLSNPVDILEIFDNHNWELTFLIRIEIMAHQGIKRSPTHQHRYIYE